MFLPPLARSQYSILVRVRVLEIVLYLIFGLVRTLLEQFIGVGTGGFDQILPYGMVTERVSHRGTY